MVSEIKEELQSRMEDAGYEGFAYNNRWALGLTRGLSMALEFLDMAEGEREEWAISRAKKALKRELKRKRRLLSRFGGTDAVLMEQGIFDGLEVSLEILQNLEMAG